MARGLVRWHAAALLLQVLVWSLMFAPAFRAWEHVLFVITKMLDVGSVLVLYVLLNWRHLYKASRCAATASCYCLMHVSFIRGGVRPSYVECSRAPPAASHTTPLRSLWLAQKWRVGQAWDGAEAGDFVE